jgi:uncharacterized protein (TIGR03435 family)
VYRILDADVPLGGGQYGAPLAWAVDMDLRLVVPAVLIWTLLDSSHLGAKPLQKRPSAEIISVKPNLTKDTRSARGVSSTGVQLTNVTTEQLLSYAFDVQPAMTQFAFQGGAKSVLSSRFDVSITTDRPIAGSDEAALVHEVLVSRFGLVTHRQLMERPVYELRRADDQRLGPFLKASEINCNTLLAQLAAGVVPEPRDTRNEPLCSRPYGFGPEMRIRFASPIAELIRRIQGFVDRPVIDATDLPGSYEWEIRFALAGMQDDQRASIYTAISEQLGLVLKARTAPYSVLVIDRLHMPDRN